MAKGEVKLNIEVASKKSDSEKWNPAPDRLCFNEPYRPTIDESKDPSKIDDTLQLYVRGLHCDAPAEQRRKMANNYDAGKCKGKSDPEKEQCLQSVAIPIDAPDMILLDQASCDKDSNNKFKDFKPKGSNINRYNGFVEGIKRLVGYKNLCVEKERFIAIKIYTRSTAEIFRWAGRMSAWSYDKENHPWQCVEENHACPCNGEEHHCQHEGDKRNQFSELLIPEYPFDDTRGVQLDQEATVKGCRNKTFMPNGSEDKSPCIRFLVVNKNGAIDENPLALVVFEGDTYWIPGDERKAGHSGYVLDIMHELIANNITGDTARIQIVPNP